MRLQIDLNLMNLDFSMNFDIFLNVKNIECDIINANIYKKHIPWKL